MTPAPFWLKSIDERIYFIRSKRWIAYPKASQRYLKFSASSLLN